MTREPPSKRQKLAEAEEVENFEVDVVEDVPASNNKDKFVPMYGNYRGYYSKRTGASGLDQRLQLVPEEWVKGKVISQAFASITGS